MKLIILVAATLFIVIITALAVTGQTAGLSMYPGTIHDVRALYDDGAPSTDTPTPTPTLATFSFGSVGDSHDNTVKFNTTINQLVSLQPAFILHNGDLEDAGCLTSQMDDMAAVLTGDGVFNNTFIVRGNHDNIIPGSDALWENYLVSANRPLPGGVTNYMALDSNSKYLNYSFDYGNSRFIGLDFTGDSTLPTSAELTFLDNRLADAENIGLTHAFIFFHVPEYCVESNHCNCSSASDSNCTPSALVSIINNHPIVSATFHGHEHILGWVHMDSSRVPGLTHSYEEFLTSPAGGSSYNDYLYPARIDYYYPDMAGAQGFGHITVSGDSFTISLYKTGTTLPVWSHTFSDADPTPIPTGTLPTSTPTLTSTTTSTPTLTATPASPSTVTMFGRNSNWKYYAQNTNLLSIPTPYYSPSYNDSTWASGNGILGFGETYLTTEFASNGGYSYYFRKTFNLSQDPATITSLTLDATYDDGYVVYINGQEVTRRSMSAGSYTYSTAGLNHESNQVYETIDLSSQIDKLVQGNNIIAVDVHNVSSGSTDIVWDASLSYLTGQPDPPNTPTPTNTPTQTNTPNPSGSNMLVYPYLGNTTTSSVAISWVTDNSGTGEVHYSQDQSYGNVVVATSSFQDGRYWYSATITGLDANTTYYYKVFNNGFNMTPWPIVTFTTSPDATGTSYKFLVVGDSQSDSASATPFPAALDIAAQMRQRNPNLVIHTGDMIFGSSDCVGSSSPWSQFIRNYFNVYQSMLGQIPFFTTIGNHEVQYGGCGYQAYESVFSLPGNAPSGHAEEFYSFDWGNAHFISLDTNQYLGTSQPEYLWLKSDLQTTTKQWKFVFLHVPAYSSGDSGSDPDVQKYLVPLFETYGVTIAFSGHDHDYERTCPILGGACTTTQNGGVVYFVNGGGGAYTSPPRGTWFTVASTDANEFLDVTMNDCQVQLNAIERTGIVFDTYTINHCGTTTPTFTPTPTQTRTNTPSATVTNTFTPTATASNTSTPTATASYTSTPTATSTPILYALIVTKTGTGSGTITSPPAGIDCGPTCSANFASNTVVTLTAAAGLTSSFTGWSGEGCSGTGTCVVTMSAARSVTATFTLNIHSISLYTGWNLVSFNLHPVPTTIETVLSGITSKYDLVYAWDAAGAHSGGGNWMIYDPNRVFGNTLANLDEKMAFWIHMTAPTTLDVVGSLPTTTNIPLHINAGGWNLVGYPSVANHDLPGALNDHGVGTAYSLVYAYHANDGAPWKLYNRTAIFGNDLTQMTPGWGYWIYVSGDNTWNVGY